MSTANQLVRALAAERGFAAELRHRAARVKGAVVLPEGEDPRISAAAVALRALGIARPVLLGSPGALRTRLRAEGADPAAFELIDPSRDPRAERLAERLYAHRRDKGLTQGEAHVLVRQPLQFGAGLVEMGVAQAMVAGAAHPTREVIRAGLYQVGLARGITVVSGSFLMTPPEGHWLDRPLLFADAAVVPAPDVDQLVSIGRSSVALFEQVVRRRPKVACLSFSTQGSADHPSARKMAEVAQRLRAAGVEADGELQVDAALVPAVAITKSPRSPLAGQADVLLFPDLNAANIGYKLAERLGNFSAMGPLLQGLSRPVFDLSRGCSAADVVNVASIALITRSEEP